MRLNIILYIFVLLESSNEVRAEKRKVDVEDYVVDWCSQQFYELKDVGKKREHHVPIEPFLGQWCFEQFGEVFATINNGNGKLGSGWKEYRSDSDPINLLYKSHLKIEDYLGQWGKLEAKSVDNVPIEPYIGDWCRAQWSDELVEARVQFHPQEMLREEVEEEVNIEPFFGRWCYESFPVALGLWDISPDQNGTSDREYVDKYIITPMLHNHVKIEIPLMKWFKEYEKSKSSVRSIIALTILLIALGGALIVLIYRCRFLQNYNYEKDNANDLEFVRRAQQNID